MIYVTRTNPDTKEAIGFSKPTAYPNFEQVEFYHGKPLHSGKRSVTYRGLFFSDYVVKAVPVTVSFL